MTLNSVTLATMFRRASTGKGLIAFLLTLTFVWSWAACSLLCSEITERHEKQSILAVEQKGESCLVGLDTEDCPYTATAAIIETRQFSVAPYLAAAKISIPASPKFSFAPTSMFPADTNQNSPPRADSDPPLFLKYHAFRI